MKVETEENQQDPSHHKCTAAYKLKKVEAFARGALHDGLDADECNQGQNLAKIGNTCMCIFSTHLWTRMPAVWTEQYTAAGFSSAESGVTDGNMTSLIGRNRQSNRNGRSSSY